MIFNIIRLFIIIVILSIFSGCVTTVTTPIDQRIVELDTLSSSVSLTIHSDNQSMAGSGYLVYCKPDRSHVVILSPFGTTLFEVFTHGNRIVLVYPSDKIAYIGSFSDLPDKGGIKEWSSIHWVLNDIAQHKDLLLQNVDNIEKNDRNEQITIKNGLVIHKSQPDGKNVYYSKHTSINGVILANELELRGNKDEQLRIVFDDPEVNGIITDSAFIPQLDGYKIYELRMFN